MIEISAGQHVYGNVEKSLSPSNTGGFQTLFYSKDLLSESETEEIEERLGYTFSEENPGKVIFFQLGERFVTTQIIPLPDVDKYGRKGAYIAHSFIFSSKDIEKIHYNPFIIFDLFQDKFVKTLADALALGKRGDLNVAPLKFSLEAEEINAFEQTMVESVHEWNMQEIKKIVNFVMNEFPKQKGIKSLVISGSQSEIRKTIKGIFSLIPDIFRSTCLFDTYFYHLNPVALKYPIYCYPTPPHSPELFQANTKSKTVSNISLDVSSPYENWVFGGDYFQDLKEKCLFRNVALELQNFLSNKEFKKEVILESIKSPNTEIFLQINQLLFQEKMDAFFKIAPTEVFAHHIANVIKNNYSAKTKANLLEKVLTRFDQEEISNGLFIEFKGIKSPKKEEIDGLKTYLAENKHQLLQVIYSKWTRNYNSLLKILNSLSDDDYTTVIELLVNEVDIKYLIVDSKFPIFIEVFVTEALKKKVVRDKTTEVVRICILHNQESLLSNLVVLIPKLTQNQIITIQEYIAQQTVDKRELIPEEFFEELATHIKKTSVNEEIQKTGKKGDIPKIVEKKEIFKNVGEKNIENNTEKKEIPINIENKNIEKMVANKEIQEKKEMEVMPQTIESKNIEKTAENKEQDIRNSLSNMVSNFKRKLKKG